MPKNSHVALMPGIGGVCASCTYGSWQTGLLQLHALQVSCLEYMYSTVSARSHMAHVVHGMCYCTYSTTAILKPMTKWLQHDCFTEKVSWSGSLHTLHTTHISTATGTHSWHASCAQPTQQREERWQWGTPPEQYSLTYHRRLSGRLAPVLLQKAMQQDALSPLPTTTYHKTEALLILPKEGHSKEWIPATWMIITIGLWDWQERRG